MEVNIKELEIKIFWSEEDNSYIATPEKKYTSLSGIGETPVKSLRSLLRVIKIINENSERGYHNNRDPNIQRERTDE